MNETSLKKALDKELADIVAFYMKKEAETLSKLSALELEVHGMEPRSLGGAVSRQASLELGGSAVASVAAAVMAGTHEAPGVEVRGMHGWHAGLC